MLFTLIFYSKDIYTILSLCYHLKPIDSQCPVHESLKSSKTVRITSHMDRVVVVVVVLVFNVPPTAKVILRQGHGLKSHPTDWRSRESNLRPLVYKASDLSTTPQLLLI